MTSPLQQKIKVTGPVVVTANRLADGAVVWRTAAGTWSTALADAAVVTTAPDALALLEGAHERDTDAVGPYIAPVVKGADGRIEPGNRRERIRVEGPTFALPSDTPPTDPLPA
ncbi:DUF2849 domain-containing protein [Ancylobacter sp. 6x-1]|uniref:DUF2849 domain-containing protein n=1 Tax=Ancylobacter crimeensis TaxID=2579147 RepID=A0ABT0DDJ5_9HYPH|nr:DUF2849 domain-containing protein [Ancylobacter crimeensis]MCK0198041.1 DUF2849 domain-containing protein [Ancylobacter crimeensis]